MVMLASVWRRMGLTSSLNSNTLSPNPASTYVHIALSENYTGYTLSLINQQGQAVASQVVTSNVAQFWVGSLINGTYYVELKKGSQLIEQSKLVVIK